MTTEVRYVKNGFMELFEVIHNRRSIRKFKPIPVPDEKIEKLLRAAMSAPSASNQQPWHFIVIRRREKLNAMAAAHPHAQMLKEAALAILVCGDTTQVRLSAYWPQDCAAATQNLLLAVHAEGLGAVWIGVYPRENRLEQIGGLFTLPKGILPFSVIAIGYPDEQKPREDRYQVSRIHQEEWS